MILSSRRNRILLSIATYAILISGAIVVAAPAVWMLSTALKHPSQVFLFPPKWIPEPIQWGNFAEALTILPFNRYLMNTLIVCVASTVGMVVSSTLVGYSFARLRWPGRDIIFFIMLTTLMLPHHVTMIPHFILYRTFGWINTLLPLFVPAFFGGPFMIFLCRQFFSSIPYELDEAAKIDGCGPLQIYLRMILPLSGPVIGIVSIFVFTANWNEFIGPLIYLHDPKLFTLSLGLRQFQGEYYTEWQLLMAASVAVLTPLVIIFFVAQKYFIRGITLFSGVNR